MSYQHNTDILITDKTFTYVQSYKKQLLQCMSKLLFDLDIKFTIAHGVLLEYARGKHIQHDDDIDIRFNVGDVEKWRIFCDKAVKDSSLLEKYNLTFDPRIGNIKAQIYNGIQCWLIEFDNSENIETFEMKIIGDLVCNIVGHKLWNVYDIDFSKTQRVLHLGVETSIPSDEDLIYILTKQWGPEYLIPDKEDVMEYRDDKLIRKDGVTHNEFIKTMYSVCKHCGVLNPKLNRETLKYTKKNNCLRCNTLLDAKIKKNGDDVQIKSNGGIKRSNKNKLGLIFLHNLK